MIVGVLCGSARSCCSPAAPPAVRGCWPSLAVAGIVISWGVAQWPYLLPESLTVSDGRRPAPAPCQALVVVVVLAALIVGPAFVLLYVLDQRSLLPDEGVDDVARRGGGRTTWSVTHD